MNPDGTPFERDYTLAVEELPESDPAAERRSAWAAFYRAEGVERLARGEFRVRPLATDALTFLIKIKERPPVRFGTYRQGVGRVLDVGTLRVLAGGRLTLSLVHESRSVPVDAVPDVEARLIRPDPGTSTSAPNPRAAPLRGRIGVGKPLQFDALPYGTYACRMSLENLHLGTETVSVLEAESTLQWRLTDETIEGRITDLDENPIDAAKLEVDRPARVTVTSDEDGRFSATFPHAGGDVVVLANLAGGVLPETRILDPRSSEARDLRFRLPSCRIEAAVRSAKEDRPISEARLLVKTLASARRGAKLSLETNLDGEARAHGLPEGSFEVRVYAKGYSEWGPKEVTLSRKHPVESLEVRLQKSGTVGGIVVSSTGSAIPGAHVRGPLRGAPEATSAEVLAGPDGRFEVEVAENHVSFLAVWARGHRLGIFPVSPRPEPVSLELVPVGASAEVEIRTIDGQEFEQTGWNLLAGGIPVDEVTVQESFLSNGCPFYTVTRSRIRLGGCLMPASYALLLTRFAGTQKELFVTESFDPTSAAVLRVIARPQP